MIESVIKDLVKEETMEQIIEKYQDKLEGISLESFRKLIDAYSGVVVELKEVGKNSEECGLTYKITVRPILAFEFGWECKTAGLWITFCKDGHLNSTLYGLPITAIKTNKYGPYFLGGEPPAASLLQITKKIMLFVSDESTPPGELLEKLGTKDEYVSDVLPVCNTSLRGPLLDVSLTDPVCVDVPAEPSRDEIIEEVFKNKSGILAIGICISGYPSKEIISRNELPIIH